MDGLHAENDRPKLGLYQVKHGSINGLASICVKTKLKIDEDLWTARQNLAINLRRAMADCDRLRDKPNKAVALESITEVGKSVINRLLKPKNQDDPYPTLETLVRLANGLGIGLYELVIDSRDMRELSERGPHREPERVEKVRSLKSR